MKAMTSLMSSMSIFTSTYSYLKRARNQSSKEIENLKSEWAFKALESLRVNLSVVGRPSEQKSLLLVGNHISYLDIAILMAVAPHVSFVSKKEIAAWPFIGAGARAINTIFVERNCHNNRKAARDTIAREIKNGARIAVFPSGTTCMDESKPWKRGAFEIAGALNIPIQPFRLSYTPIRKAAYINRDFFPLHMFQVAQSGQVKAQIEFHPPVQVNNPDQDCFYWQEWSRPRSFGSPQDGSTNMLPTQLNLQTAIDL